MSFTASHVGFVLAAYGLSAAVIALLVITHIARARRTARRLAELDAQGVPRRKKSQTA